MSSLDEITLLTEQYLAWIGEKVRMRAVGGAIEITTPFLDRHNDYLQLYAIPRDDGYVLTDDGYVLTDLALSGCKLESKKRRSLLTSTLNGFGVLHVDGRLEIETTKEDFAVKEQNLIQAMLAVNDMSYLASATVENLFYEDVMAWLSLRRIAFTEDVTYAGKSGAEYTFDFRIPGVRGRPTSILSTVPNPTMGAARNLAFAWIETAEQRPADTRGYVLLNDAQRSPKAQVLSILQSYNLQPCAWKDRDSLVPQFAA